MITDRVEQQDFSHFGNLFEKLFDETEYPNNTDPLKHCNYYSCEEFLQNNMSYKNNFSVFSHNVRSLSNKWDDFKQILNDFSTGNFKFSAICLQEIWA